MSTWAEIKAKAEAKTAAEQCEKYHKLAEDLMSMLAHTTNLLDQLTEGTRRDDVILTVGMNHSKILEARRILYTEEELKK